MTIAFVTTKSYNITSPYESNFALLLIPLQFQHCYHKWWTCSTVWQENLNTTIAATQNILAEFPLCCNKHYVSLFSNNSDTHNYIARKFPASPQRHAASLVPLFSMTPACLSGHKTVSPVHWFTLLVVNTVQVPKASQRAKPKIGSSFSWEK